MNAHTCTHTHTQERMCMRREKRKAAGEKAAAGPLDEAERERRAKEAEEK